MQIQPFNFQANIKPYAHMQHEVLSHANIPSLAPSARHPHTSGHHSCCSILTIFLRSNFLHCKSAGSLPQNVMGCDSELQKLRSQTSPLAKYIYLRDLQRCHPPSLTLPLEETRGARNGRAFTISTTYLKFPSIRLLGSCVRQEFNLQGL